MTSTPKLIALIVIVAAGLYAANVKTNDLGWLPVGLVGFLMLMDAFLAAEKASARETKEDKPALPLGEDWGRSCRALVWPTTVPPMHVLVATLAAFALSGGESCHAKAENSAAELEQGTISQTDKQNVDELKAPKSTQDAKSTNQPSAGGTKSRFKLVNRHVWGEDMSQSLQGAGGIAGLLRTETVSEHQPSTPPPSTSAYFSYDSNGNVILLTNAEAKPTARYAYDAFGKTTQATGPAVQTNRYRFSTKPIELGSGLAFYGYRYYSPELGRWVSRDPIAERGGVNIYAMTGNQVVNEHDTLGLAVPLLVYAGAVVWEGICSAAAAAAAALASTEAVAAVGTVFVVTQVSSSSTTCPRCEVLAQEQTAKRQCPKIGEMISGAGFMCIYKCEGGMQFMEPMGSNGCDPNAEEPDWAKPNSD